MFEDLHGAESAGKFAEDLRAATNRYYGTPIQHFLAQLTARYAADPAQLHELINTSRDDFLAKHLPFGAAGQVRSVCGRFALVATAGSVATAFGLTGWPDDEADRAAAICFNAWLQNRDGAGDHEIEAGIRQVSAFLEAYGSSRFELAWQTPVERIPNRVGFRRLEGETWRYYILPEMWRREVAKGYDPTALAPAMMQRGHILPGKDGKPASQKKIPKHGNQRVYVLAPNITAMR